MKKTTCVSALLLCSFFISGAGYSFGQESSEQKAISELRKQGKAFSAVARKVSPAVVMIKVEKEVSSHSQRDPFRGMLQDEFMRRFFQLPPKNQAPAPNKKRKRSIEVGQGSGFIISSEGHILTNNHVLGNADTFKVHLLDGRIFEAKLAGRDPQSDIALIKIEAKKDLPHLKLGNAERLEVGEWVLAVGNPFGLSHTLTAGIVSAKGRNSVGISDYEDFIQTDAAINPGNSGGPLVNLDGEVVGMNTAIFSRSGGYMGIGFAIPSDMLSKITDQLKQDGSVNRGYIGIYMQELTQEMNKLLDIQGGVLVSQVGPGTPAEKAGLKTGDIITSFNKKRIKSAMELRNAVAMIRPGEDCPISLLRGEKKLSLTITVGNRNQMQASILGMEVEKISPQLQKKFGLTTNSGVVIVKVDKGSEAARLGLQEGQIILSVNRLRVNNKKDFFDAINRKEGKLLLLISDRGRLRYVLLKR